MDESKVDINALGQIIDSSWGRSSTPQTSSYSIKTTLVSADRIQVTYQVVVNFRSNVDLIRAKRSYEEESIAIIGQVVKGIKKSYKDLAEETLTTKELSSTDSVEVVGRTSAIYRRKTVLEIG